MGRVVRQQHFPRPPTLDIVRKRAEDRQSRHAAFASTAEQTLMDVAPSGKNSAAQISYTYLRGCSPLPVYSAVWGLRRHARFADYMVGAQRQRYHEKSRRSRVNVVGGG